MKRRARVQGVPQLRRKLRRLPDAASDLVRAEVARGLRDIEMDAVGLVPVREGDLARSIEVKVSRDGLTGVVGPGAGAAEIVRRKTGSAFAFNSPKVNLRAANRDALFQFFKGYWLEFGTKGESGEDVITPRPFMSPAYDANAGAIKRRIAKAIDRALAVVAAGR
jgi:hypothetical protein